VSWRSWWKRIAKSSNPISPDVRVSTAVKRSRSLAVGILQFAFGRKTLRSLSVMLERERD
jgi:hypothetical protein